MTSNYNVAATTAPTALTRNTTLAAIASPKPVAQAATSYGPAATVQLSQKALALAAGDKDWKPGLKIDSF